VPETKISNFQIIRQLGTGGYAEVFLARLKESEQLFAVKVLRKPVSNRRVRGVKVVSVAHLMVERSALQIFEHPNIVSLKFAFQDPKFWFLVMDFKPGGELHQLRKQQPNARFTLDVVKTWTAQLVSALMHMHSAGFVHRDIKPENILLDSNNHVCLTDFGLSAYLPTERKKDKMGFCGTSEYLAPEVVNRTMYSYEIDWWALGVCVFEMLAGYTAFNPPGTGTNEKLRHNIVFEDPVFPADIACQPAYQPVMDLCSQLLKKSSFSRLGSKSMEDVCAHPFFNGIDWPAVHSGCLPYIPISGTSSLIPTAEATAAQMGVPNQAASVNSLGQAAATHYSTALQNDQHTTTTQNGLATSLEPLSLPTPPAAEAAPSEEVGRGLGEPAYSFLQTPKSCVQSSPKTKEGFELMGFTFNDDVLGSLSLSDDQWEEERGTTAYTSTSSGSVRSQWGSAA